MHEMIDWCGTSSPTTWAYLVRVVNLLLCLGLSLDLCPGQLEVVDHGQEACHDIPSDAISQLILLITLREQHGYFRSKDEHFPTQGDH